MQKLTEKQKRFADFYIELGNATAAAIEAGYSEKSAKEIGNENLTKPHLKNYIDEQLDKMKTKRMADATEVLEYLTSVMRGEATAEVVVVEGIGLGTSEARTLEKHPDEKERLKAAELLAKRHGLLNDKLDLTVTELGWYKEVDEK
ncbi:MAG: terminase small subunit [Firmicutes bacterium]|nr:terminase small subunit [Bacillota bacterium]